MSRLLILCSGQGGQHPGMFDLARTDARAAQLLDACGAQADPARLYENEVAQPAIVAAALAMWEALRAEAPSPAMVAGYSIGELAAYGVAGALRPQECVALATTRARLMDRCVAPGRPHGMLAVSDLLVDAVDRAAARFGCHVAIINDADKCIVGGLASDLDALQSDPALASARLQRIPVNIASHTPLMAGAVAPFAAALRDTAFGMPAFAVAGGIDGARVHTPESAIEHLSRQLAEPIRWSDCLDACAEAGVDVALELGPGAALSAMLRARHPHIATRSVSDFRTLDGIRAWLARAG
jgi:[acyl-carrier-protein] S-malonyltransferase